MLNYFINLMLEILFFSEVNVFSCENTTEDFIYKASLDGASFARKQQHQRHDSIAIPSRNLKSRSGMMISIV